MKPRDNIVKILLAEYEQELAKLSLAELLAHMTASRKMSSLSNEDYRDLAQTLEEKLGEQQLP